MVDTNVNVTAKVKCVRHEDLGDEQTALGFEPDYEDDRNREWAKYTPALSLSLTVKGEVAEHFQRGDTFDLTFTKTQS